MTIFATRRDRVLAVQRVAIIRKISLIRAWLDPMRPMKRRMPKIRKPEKAPAKTKSKTPR
jgi:hypothetical protein